MVRMEITSRGVYTLGTVLLKFYPRQSNNKHRLVCIQIIKSICNALHFRRIKTWWMDVSDGN